MAKNAKTFDYVCPLDKFGRVAEEGSLIPCGFVSRGWPTQEAADATGAAHEKEHETGEPMPELADRKAS